MTTQTLMRKPEMDESGHVEGKLPFRTIPGQLSLGDIIGILSLARKVPENGIVVEVGALYGLSSWIWAQNVPETARVVSIDPWEHKPWMDQVKNKFGTGNLSKEAFLENTYDCKNIEAVQGFSPDVLKDWQTPIDLFFEDAVHTNPILGRNLEFWTAHVKPGGFVAGHDYREVFPDVVNAAHALSEEYGTPLNVRGTVWWVQKPL